MDGGMDVNESYFCQHSKALGGCVPRISNARNPRLGSHQDISLGLWLAPVAVPPRMRDVWLRCTMRVSLSSRRPHHCLKELYMACRMSQDPFDVLRRS